MESRTGKKREIALGLDPYYKLLAEQTQSVPWKGGPSTASPEEGWTNALVGLFIRQYGGPHASILPSTVFQTP
jgi:hypothetical protein